MLTRGSSIFYEATGGATPPCRTRGRPRWRCRNCRGRGASRGTGSRRRSRRRGVRGRRGIPKFPGDAAAWWRGGGEAKKSGERAVARHGVGRERWQGIERWEGVGFYKARRTPRAKTSARPAAFSRARAILSRRLCYLYSLLYCYIYFIFNIYLHFYTLYSFFSLKNRVGDDGVPAILQYRSSDLYPTDRKETMAIL